MRVAVLGAAGAAALVIVRDLAGSAEVDGLTLLDLDGEGARALAAAHGEGKATGAAVDGADRQALTLALEGHGLLVNAATDRVSLAAMDACLAAGCGYLDLGAPDHVSARQYALHDAFAAAGLLAVLGCGAAPGATKVMGARAAAAARLYARGVLGRAGAGVLAAEIALPAQALSGELEACGRRIGIDIQTEVAKP